MTQSTTSPATPPPVREWVGQPTPIGCQGCHALWAEVKNLRRALMQEFETVRQLRRQLAEECERGEQLRLELLRAEKETFCHGVRAGEWCRLPRNHEGPCKYQKGQVE